jgi:hypothetical protein
MKNAPAFAFGLMEPERQKVDLAVPAFLKAKACVRQISR